MSVVFFLFVFFKCLSFFYTSWCCDLGPEHRRWCEDLLYFECLLFFFFFFFLLFFWQKTNFFDLNMLGKLWKSGYPLKSAVITGHRCHSAPNINVGKIVLTYTYIVQSAFDSPRLTRILPWTDQPFNICSMLLRHLDTFNDAATGLQLMFVKVSRQVYHDKAYKKVSWS